MQFERFVKIIAVGKMKEKHLAALTDDFLIRLRKYGKCEVVILPDSDVAREGEAICRELDKERNSTIFILSEEGREWTTAQFSRQLETLDRRAVFVIGGPFGLSDSVKQRADQLWSLSKLTFTHEMARFLLCEQLYRALNYLNGGGYHHE
jgi:23S rRNA (pseudouridine1915-N3)-methyltransferase